jgi:hypothetical protein
MMTPGRAAAGALLAIGLSAATGLASVASLRGWGAEESRDDPVSVRHESVDGHGFFGSWTGRSHWGGRCGRCSTSART